MAQKDVKSIWGRDIKRELGREWLGIALPGSLKILNSTSMREMGHTIRTVVYRFDTSSGRRFRVGMWVNGKRRMDDKVAGI